MYEYVIIIQRVNIASDKLQNIIKQLQIEEIR